MQRRDFLRRLGLSAIAGTAVRLGPWHGVGASAQTGFPRGASPDVELVLRAEPGAVPILPGALTKVWRFTGQVIKGPAEAMRSLPDSYLGPVIRVRRGQRVRLRFINQLPEESIVHWHGLDVPEAADGHPRFAIGAAGEFVYDFEVTNRAGTYWYHPHPHMRTASQVYQGLAGLFIVGDPEEDRLGLPSGDAELLAVIQDRTFDARNQLVFHGSSPMELMDGFLGTRALVNGQAPLARDVDAAWHRVRLLNGSNARIYKLAWNHGLEMTVIGSDGGLFEGPVKRPALTLAPGQRADLLLDLTAFAPGTEVRLESQAFPEADAGTSMMGMRGMMGMMSGSRPEVPNGAPLPIMTLRVRDRKGPAFHVPEVLSSLGSAWALRESAPRRRVPLVFGPMRWLIDGRAFSMTDVAPEETVAAGSTHLWEFVNQTDGMMGMQAAHPIHLHGAPFRVVSRTGGAPGNTLRPGIVDDGWRDTVLVLPGETVRVQVTFTHHPGLYLYHCHILEHEDMGMMRNFRVV